MNRVVEKYTNTSEEAKALAQSMAGDCGGRYFPCVAFSQGGRTVLSTGIAFKDLQGLVDTGPSLVRGGDPVSSTNRPYDPQHAKSIRRYMTGNPKAYVLGPLCLAFNTTITVFRPEALASAGFFVVPGGAKAKLLDGQHRFYAVLGRDKVGGTLDSMPSLDTDGIGLHIVAEDDLDRVRQDFADMAKTKALPASLLTAYNLRDPANIVVKDVCQRAPILQNGVDFTSKTVGKGSRSLVVANWVLGMLLGRVARDYTSSGITRDKVIQEALATEGQQERITNDLLFLFESMVKHIPLMGSIQTIDPKKAGVEIPKIRNQVLVLTAVGLGLSGMVMRRIVEVSQGDKTREAALVMDLYTKVSWLRGPQIDSVWTNGGVLTSGGAISNSRSAFNTSFQRILERLDIAPVKP